jgi:MFS family permease
LRFRLSILMFLQWAVPGTVLPLYSLRLASDLGFDPLQTGACCATQAVAAVCASLLAGQVADRWFSAERTLAVCAFLAGLDLWVLAELTTLPGVFLATLLFWLLCGPLLMLGTTVGFAHLPFPEKQFSGVRLWGTVGWMSAVLLAGCWLSGPPWLTAALAWVRPHDPRPERADAFRLGGVLALVLAGYALTLPRTPPTRPVGAANLLAPLAAMKLLRGGPFATYSLCMLGACITMPFTTQNTPLLLEQLGVPRAWLGPLQTPAQVTEVLALALLPVLLLRLGLRGTMLLGLGAWVVSLSVLALGRPVELVVASQVLNGLFIAGFMVAGQVFVNGQAAGDLRASAQGLFTFVNGVGLLIGNLLAGGLRAWAGARLADTFAVAAVFTGVLLVVFVLGFWHDREAT